MSEQISVDKSNELSVLAGKVFQPRTPITTQELFAGRWEQMTKLVDAVGQIGLHVIIYGERGVGKTSLANVLGPVVDYFDEKEKTSKRLIVRISAVSTDTFSSIWLRIFSEIGWNQDKPIQGLARTPTKDVVSMVEAFRLGGILNADEVRRLLSLIPRAVFIIDEFDRAAHASSKDFTDLIKSLADFSVDCTVILVGVSDTVGNLISDHASIPRALEQINLPRMPAKDIQQILTNAETKIGVKFQHEAASLIVHISQGLPHYTHLVGQHSVRKATNRRSSEITRKDVFEALKDAMRQAEQTVSDKYSKAKHSAHTDALYRQVLFACAIAAAQSHEPLGYFQPAALVAPLELILRRNVQISVFNNHLSEFCNAKRGSVLERSGQARMYRFRFNDPLLVPFIFMDAVNTELVSESEIDSLLNE